ncbi:hypothetical protein KM043_015389 [Ampulex compressa]|nr:hypothetical protein KM043_015389 [Ampulex compressa]
MAAAKVQPREGKKIDIQSTKYIVRQEYPSMLFGRQTVGPLRGNLKPLQCLEIVGRELPRRTSRYERKGGTPSSCGSSFWTLDPNIRMKMLSRRSNVPRSKRGLFTWKAVGKEAGKMGMEVHSAEER